MERDKCGGLTLQGAAMPPSLYGDDHAAMGPGSHRVIGIPITGEENAKA